MFYRLFILCIVGGAVARRAESSPELCRNDFQTVEDLDITRLSGYWYQALRTYNIFQKDWRCQQYYFVFGDYNRFIIYDTKIVGNETQDTTIEGGVPDTTMMGLHETTYLHSSGSVETMVHKYLGVDYKSYIVLGRCQQKGNKKVDLIEIYTRERHPSESVIAKAMSVIEDRGLDVSRLFPTVQENCQL